MVRPLGAMTACGQMLIEGRSSCHCRLLNSYMIYCVHVMHVIWLNTCVHDHLGNPTLLSSTNVGHSDPATKRYPEEGSFGETPQSELRTV